MSSAPIGEALAIGTIGGSPVELDPGTHRVEVLTDPPVAFDAVELASGGHVTLELPGVG